jgi:hypothetical protein
MPKKTARKPAKAAVKKKPVLNANVVVVPRPARGSYNPNRPLAKNTLLLNQVRHFQEAEKKLPVKQRTGHDPKKIRTERHAAEYIKKMTVLLHPQGGEAPSVLKAGGR